MALIGLQCQNKKKNYKIIVFDEVYVLFHFNIIRKHNGKFSTKVLRYIVHRRFSLIVLWKGVEVGYCDEL